MPSQEERDQIIEFCEFCQHPEPYHTDGPTGACRADGTDSLRCKCLSFQRGKMSEETKTIERPQYIGVDSEIEGDAKRKACYNAWSIYRDYDEANDDCADLCDFRAGFLNGYDAGLTAERERREAAERTTERCCYDAHSPKQACSKYNSGLLDCPICGACNAFVISQTDPADGFCRVEGKVHTVRVLLCECAVRAPGKNVCLKCMRPYHKDGSAAGGRYA